MLRGMWQEATRSDWRLSVGQKRDFCNDLVTLQVSHTVSRTGLFIGAGYFTLLSKVIIWPQDSRDPLACCVLRSFIYCQHRRPLEGSIAYTRPTLWLLLLNNCSGTF